MKLRVREEGDDIHIDVEGVAGRQQRVLQALTECQRRMHGTGQASTVLAGIRIRAGANTLRIRIAGRNGVRFEAAAIYQCLRKALLDRALPEGAATHPTP